MLQALEEEILAQAERFSNQAGTAYFVLGSIYLRLGEEFRSRGSRYRAQPSPFERATVSALASKTARPHATARPGLGTWPTITPRGSSTLSPSWTRIS